MSNEDFLALARRIINLFPQIREAVTTAAIMAGGLYAFLNVLEPLLEPKLKGYLQLYPLNSAYIFLLILTVCFTISIFDGAISKRAREQQQFESVVDVLERVMVRARFTKIEQKLIWRGVVTELAKSAKLDGVSPTATQLQAAAQREMNELGKPSANS